MTPSYICQSPPTQLNRKSPFKNAAEIIDRRAWDAFQPSQTVEQSAIQYSRSRRSVTLFVRNGPSVGHSSTPTVYSSLPRELRKGVPINMAHGKCGSSVSASNLLSASFFKQSDIHNFTKHSVLYIRGRFLPLSKFLSCRASSPQPASVRPSRFQPIATVVDQPDRTITCLQPLKRARRGSLRCISAQSQSHINFPSIDHPARLYPHHSIP